MEVTYGSDHTYLLHDSTMSGPLNCFFVFHCNHIIILDGKWIVKDIYMWHVSIIIDLPKIMVGQARTTKN